MLDKAIEILDLLARDTRARAATEIANECGLPLSTTLRILNSLEGKQILYRDEPTRKFALGARWGMKPRNSYGELRRIAAPFMRNLQRQTGETVLLSGLTDDRLASFCIERIESVHQLRIGIQPGGRHVLYHGSNQKALLAYMAPDEIERVLSSAVDPEAVKNIASELQLIRRRGYACSIGETPGVTGVSVTLLSVGGESIVSIAVASPTVRMKQARISQAVQQLRATGERISERSQYRLYKPSRETVDSTPGAAT